MDRFTLHHGDCLEVLRAMESNSVHCVVTSPPYYGLRDYGTATWEGGDGVCDHVVGEIRTGLGMRELSEQYRGGGLKASEPKMMTAKGICPKCGARRIDHQIGLEETPEAYVARMVEVFREVRRVLRDDGTCWVNLGDTYNNCDKWGGGGANTGKHTKAPDGSVESWKAVRRKWSSNSDLKPKDLIGIPWMVAFALRSDGWYLRQDIIWHKPNPMPESVTDRCTKSHEYIFLLTKSARYFYDSEAVKEDACALPKPCGPKNDDSRNDSDRTGIVRGDGVTRNRRSVWTVATKPFTGAHFAVFPPDLIRPCILAGCPGKCCPVCGKGWERVVEKGLTGVNECRPGNGMPGRSGAGLTRQRAGDSRSVTIGHQPACACNAPSFARGVTLDPFTGSGTTGVVSVSNQRNFIGIELNPEYHAMAVERINAALPKQHSMLDLITPAPIIPQIFAPSTPQPQTAP